MNVNEPESRGGIPAVLSAVGALAVVILALIGVLAVFEVIPREALQEWLTKLALTCLIIVAAVVALAMLMRAGRR
jgi:hypothetical protein